MLKIGELAEWSNAAVLKTVEGHTSGGSNPSFSAKGKPERKFWFFCFQQRQEPALAKRLKTKKQIHEVDCGFL